MGTCHILILLKQFLLPSAWEIVITNVQVSKSMMELLSPAGNLETALAAFDGGADAVYCGLEKFSARARAENFTPESMGKLINFASEKGKKVS